MKKDLVVKKKYEYFVTKSPKLHSPLKSISSGACPSAKIDSIFRFPVNKNCKDGHPVKSEVDCDSILDKYHQAELVSSPRISHEAAEMATSKRTYLAESRTFLQAVPPKKKKCREKKKSVSKELGSEEPIVYDITNDITNRIAGGTRSSPCSISSDEGIQIGPRKKLCLIDLTSPKRGSVIDLTSALYESADEGNSDVSIVKIEKRERDPDLTPELKVGLYFSDSKSRLISRKSLSVRKSLLGSSDLGFGVMGGRPEKTPPLEDDDLITPTLESMSEDNKDDINLIMPMLTSEDKTASLDFTLNLDTKLDCTESDLREAGSPSLQPSLSGISRIPSECDSEGDKISDKYSLGGAKPPTTSLLNLESAFLCSSEGMAKMDQDIVREPQLTLEGGSKTPNDYGITTPKIDILTDDKDFTHFLRKNTSIEDARFVLGVRGTSYVEASFPRPPPPPPPPTHTSSASCCVYIIVLCFLTC